MTTIVANRECMAADSMVTDGSTFYYTNKLRVIRGMIVGAAGPVDSTNAFLDWLRDGGGPPYPELRDDDDLNFVGLVLAPNGLFLYSACGEPDPLDDPYYAIGSGRGPALAMMKLGHTPREAVDMAKEINPNTGGKTRVITLKEAQNWRPKRGA